MFKKTLFDSVPIALGLTFGLICIAALVGIDKAIDSIFRIFMVFCLGFFLVYLRNVKESRAQGEKRRA